MILELEGNIMKAKLRTIKCLSHTKKRTKPIDYFKKCPKCGEQHLIHLNPDVLCSSCDWDSSSWDVSRGAMDDLVKAAEEIFLITPILVVNQNKIEAPKPQLKFNSNKNRRGA